MSLWMHQHIGTPCFYRHGVEAESPTGEVAFHVCEGCEEISFLVRGDVILQGPMEEFGDLIDFAIEMNELTLPSVAAEFLALKLAVEENDDAPNGEVL
jgi:hypothetical protein